MKKFILEDLTGEEIARFVAHEKAASFRNEISDNEIVIAADTIVWCNNRVLGKPLNREDAVRILKEISGNTHEVITGVSILSLSKDLPFPTQQKLLLNHSQKKKFIFI